ncbi:unnamed protein product [Peronospora farinosa]|uniref:BRCT domain-containing protein n=1 Tax=Peronospora farinosa TaxID=134698 RepID=A0ABN8CL47_9STRA|nr:unnamed protein product [Peronospora farinosa]
MESPPASFDTRHLSDVSVARPDSPLKCLSDSSTESQQCSADPNAFLGFYVPSKTKNMDVRLLSDSEQQQSKKETLKLVLDLEVTTDDVAREMDDIQAVTDSTSDNLFNTLFTGDPPDNDNGIKSVTLMAETKKHLATKDQVSEVWTIRTDQEKKRSLNSPRSMFKSMDNAWKARKKQKRVNKYETTQVQEDGKKEKLRDTDEVIRAFSKNREELVSSDFQTAYTSSTCLMNDVTVNEVEKKRWMLEHEEKIDKSVITEDSDRETDYEDELECTQPLIEETFYADETCNYEGRDDADTEVYPSSENDTILYGADCVLEEDRKHEKTSSERTDAANVDYSREKHSVVVPTSGRTNPQRSGEDEVTSREGSQGTQQDYLTPRVSPCRVGQSDRSEVNDELITIVDPKDNVEQITKTSQSDDDQDECVPTQPSKLWTEDECVVKPKSLSKQNRKESDELLARSQTHVTDSQSKSIRSLEFFSIVPESQEGEPYSSAILSGNSTRAAKRLDAFTGSNRQSPIDSSMRPVCLPTSTPTQQSDDDITAPEVAIDNQTSPKSRTMSSLQPDLPLNKKKPKTISQISDLQCQTVSTPIAKKRNNDAISPDNNTSSQRSNGSSSQTPRHRVRRNSRSAQSTPSSTPTARTRIWTLTPVPSQRTYVSRSRTLFKYKFEFCLTGFVKNGEKNLKELIEGHGGKIPERYQDVLFKANQKAVVIATLISWRKRKFMQAVACGIPVVHTDWIKDCIEAGHVIPFDGYRVPIGYSVTTRKFECFPPKELRIFEGLSFGIASDVAQMSKSETKDKAKLMAFILKACGAEAVYENLSTRDSINVDVMLCDEYTPTCRYYKTMRHIPVKGFQWVTECMILQQLLDPEEPGFEPLRVGSEDVFAASAEIGDSDNTTLKLYKGELVMADIAGSIADHYLLFNVCEILSIHMSGRKDGDSQSKRKDCKESRVILRVGILKREPYNPELSKPFVKVLDISSFQVKRRVVAISKEHYSQLNWRTLLQNLHFLLDNETEGEALTWCGNGSHCPIQRTREVRLAKQLGLRVCSLHQVLETLNFECQEADHWNFTIYRHDCFVLGRPEKIEQIPSHNMPLFSTDKDVVMPSVAYSSSLKPLEVRLSLSDTRSQSWEVTIAPSVLPHPTFDATDVSCYHESSSTENSWGDMFDESDQGSDHDMNSPLWWSQRSDFSSICTDDLSDMDTLSQISTYYT